VSCHGGSCQRARFHTTPGLPGQPRFAQKSCPFGRRNRHSERLTADYLHTHNRILWLFSTAFSDLQH
jgi:hypothetical protein